MRRYEKQLGNEISRGMKQYMESLKSFKSLTKEEEHRLLRKYRDEGDLQARDELIRSNLKFACSIAVQYSGKGVPFEELVSEANDGLMESIEKFDLSQDIKLFSYSVWWIKQRVRSAIEKKTRMQFTDLPEECSYVGVDTVEDSDDSDYGPLVTQPFVDDGVDDNETGKRKFIENILSSLTERESGMLSMYYGIGCKECKLEDVGHHYGVSKERARQVVEGAMRKSRCKALVSSQRYL